jgi:hypothetical protein
MADDSDILQVIALIPGADGKSLEIVMLINQTERHFQATYLPDDIPFIAYDDELHRILLQYPWVAKSLAYAIGGHFRGRPVQLPLTLPSKRQC